MPIRTTLPPNGAPDTDREPLLLRPLTVAIAVGLALPFSASAADRDLARLPDAKPRNAIYILVDDLRYDSLGFMNHGFLKTPHIDALASGGVNFRNAFVTTALCSPSRASVLTGLYVHNHKVVDNNDLAPPGTVFFPEYLQAAGYDTAFVGKWHMGGSSDDPRPGFHHWVSFRGQGFYNSPRADYSWNVDGRRVPQKGYVTDELTEYAIDWLNKRGDRPFFLYLSHKAVHAMFEPAERHKGMYAGVEIEEPATQADTPENYEGRPMWVRNQRNGWHGVDFPYHGELDIKEYYRQYCETLMAVDDSVGRLMDWLKEKNLDESTVVMFMGDNGFLFGEHGLIDKRNAYEESMRVPLVAHCPELFAEGTVVDGVVANIDIAPTVLELAGLKAPGHMDGRSFLGLATGELDPSQWRQELLYEYYWEWNFPHTPTMFALRGDRYKFIQYHGIWDSDELYDLRDDPHETRNLIRDPEHRQRVAQFRRRLYQILEETGGMQIPLGRKMGDGANLRSADGAKAAEFPEYLLRSPERN